MRRSILELAPRRVLASRVLALVLASFAPAQAQPTAYVVQPGDTLTGIATAFGLGVGELAAANGIVDVDEIAVGQRLLLPALEWPDPLPAPFEEVTLTPPDAVQGRVQTLTLRLADGASLIGLDYLGLDYLGLDGPSEDRLGSTFADGERLRALLVTPVLQPTGRVALALRARAADGGETALVLPIVVADGGFRREQITLSAETSALLDPAIVAAEHALLETTCAAARPERRWTGPFAFPVAAPEFTSRFGTLRSYNGGPYRNFHRGLDFRGAVGTPVVAAADGVVTFAGELRLYGNTVIVDHGLGVCSAYMHLSERRVETGATLRSGDPLGAIGATGLVTGPHLHWEIRVGGVPVAPLQWVEEAVGF